MKQCHISGYVFALGFAIVSNLAQLVEYPRSTQEFTALELVALRFSYSFAHSTALTYFGKISEG